MTEQLWEFIRSKYIKYSEIPTISGVRICIWNDRTELLKQEKKKKKRNPTQTNKNLPKTPSVTKNQGPVVRKTKRKIHIVKYLYPLSSSDINNCLFFTYLGTQQQMLLREVDDFFFRQKITLICIWGPFQIANPKQIDRPSREIYSGSIRGLSNTHMIRIAFHSYFLMSGRADLVQKRRQTTRSVKFKDLATQLLYKGYIQSWSC